MDRKINFKCTSYYKVFIEHEIINIEKLTCSTLLHTRYYPGTQPVTYVCPYVVRWTWGIFVSFPWVSAILPIKGRVANFGVRTDFFSGLFLK